MMIPQIFTQDRGPVNATAHEAECGINKSPNRVRVYYGCNKTENLLYL
jgi:hypothetical protein